jgi:hypothetical protein
LYKVNIQNGIALHIGDLGISASFIGLAYDQFQNSLYANVVLSQGVDGRIGSLYSTDTADDSSTLIGIKKRTILR